jgi:DNA-binding LacI/PurR family transcriptional regulator
MAASDVMAIGVLYEARRRGVAVPEELSVVGIDDHEMSYLHDLTTVRQNVALQGRTAAELLLSQMLGEPRGRRREVVAPTELVRRGSTARVRRARVS